MAACVPGIPAEVELGTLAVEILRLMPLALGDQPRLRRIASDGVPSWEGTVLIGSRNGGEPAIREVVTPLAPLRSSGVWRPRAVSARPDGIIPARHIGG